MRNALNRSLIARAAREDFVFLTGDVGYAALEGLRDAMGRRFINAGAAEQNMVSVAAGLARQGLRPWVYTIAPFLYARPFEQIRNDVCFHNLPVVLAGNGGGYGYGVMGATHHALEDYGTLLTLPHLRAFVPAFASDVEGIIDHLFADPAPAYLRLGRSEEPKGFVPPPYAPWRKLVAGGGRATLLIIGPLVGPILEAILRMDPAAAPDLWLLAELPVTTFPPDFLADLKRSDHLIVVEEHVATGSAGQQIASLLLARGLAPRRFHHRTALGYVSGLYGSQKFHRAESGLDPASLLALLDSEDPTP
jgi:transketolase